jgi:hypothetical protein
LVRVIGDSRRDVYGGPNGGLIGKVEPRAILRVLQVIEIRNLNWLLFELQSGQMYSNGSPVRELERGWVVESNVEAVNQDR